MKKIVFLISLCLLSQNYTIENTRAVENTVPLPMANNSQTINESAQIPNQTEVNLGAPPVPEYKPVIVETPVLPTTKEIVESPKQSQETILVQEIDNYAETKNEKPLNLWAEKKQELPTPQITPKEYTATITTVKLKAVEFSESRVFTPEELQKLAEPLLNKPVTITDIKKTVSDITRCYILSNYATSRAYLPPQDLVNGVLQIGLFEGTIGNIEVKNNRWTKKGYIESRISLNEGDIFDVEKLEKDVIKFNNNNNSIKLRVGLSAGENQGQTNITLNTEEQFPFHIAFMTDNQGRQTIGTTRWGGMLAADSLFGHRDRMSLGGFLGKGNRVGFIDYNFPINKYGTRLGASVSTGNIDVVNGPLRQFGIGGTSQVYSVYATHPIIDKQDFNLTSYTASNIKRSTTDISGYKLPTLSTFSVTQGFHAKKDTEKGIWYTGHYGVAGFEALGGDEDFFKYEGNITRLHDFGHGIIGQFRLSGQYSPERNLPWLEQFQIGGLSTVRGYSEATLIGRSGYFASAELMTPLPFLPKAIGSDKLGYIYPREMIKGAIFMDNGMIFPYKNGQAIDSGDLLMSWGLGLRINLKKDLAARLYWGFGLTNKYDVDQRMGRFHFDITCAPDIGRIVADRKPKVKNKKENL